MVNDNSLLSSKVNVFMVQSLFIFYSTTNSTMYYYGRDDFCDELTSLLYKYETRKKMLKN